MTLTARDQKLLNLLLNYSMFTTKQINKLIFEDIAITTVLRRLRILEEKKYIKRLMGLNSKEALWILAEKGIVFVGGEYFKRSWNKNLLEHDYKLLCLRLLLEERGIVKSWIPEHEIRFHVFKKYGHKGAQNHLVPDGLMNVSNNLKRSTVAIELELTLKNKDRLKDVFRRYRDKEGLDYIWYLCANQMILNGIQNAWSKSGGTGKAELHCSLLTDVMSAPTAHCLAQWVSREESNEENFENNVTQRIQNEIQTLHTPLN